MRTWRVGTISMGISLLSLGIFLFVSQILSIDLTKIMLAWWPMILIVLGLEILLYLFFNRKEKPLLKYDFLSIIFVGIIGMTGILFATLSTTGLLDLAEEAIGQEKQTYDLPAYSEKIDDSVKRVVVNTTDYPLTVESTTDHTVSMFGTYSGWTKEKGTILSKADDYLSSQKKGDTLYLTIKSLPSSHGRLINNYTDMQGTLLIPEHVKLEIIGAGNRMTIKPRILKNDWSFDRASEIALYLQSGSDINVTAFGAHDLISDSAKWTVTEGKRDNQVEANSEEEATYTEAYESDEKSGSFKLGEGTNAIRITDTDTVRLKIE